MKEVEVMTVKELAESSVKCSAGDNPYLREYRYRLFVQDRESREWDEILTKHRCGELLKMLEGLERDAGYRSEPIRTFILKNSKESQKA